MKNILILLLASATAATNAIAFEPTAMPRTTETHHQTEAELLEDLLNRTRVSSGMERGVVVDQLGAPQRMIHPDVWVFTGFRASNVFGGESYDTLVVAFRNDRVAKITLTTERDVRAAMAGKPSTRVPATAE